MLLLFHTEFSDSRAKAGDGWGSSPSNEADHVTRNRGGFSTSSGSFPEMVISKLGFADAVYMDLSVLFPLQENSVAVAAGRVTLETDSMP